MGPKRHQLRAKGVKARRPKHHIRLNVLQVVLPKRQLCAQLLQLQHLRQKLLSGGLIPALYRNIPFQQHSHQRTVADAKSDHADPLAPEGFKIFIYCHMDQSLITFL